MKGIVMHWTATPGASALNERNYFNGTCIADKRYASAHYLWTVKRRSTSSLKRSRISCP
ncbi:hypothetical protein PO124_31045 [Bacillus licheniformis]|nr:hypothetical protein [Bacillus licheniformis]